jgi:hypothetical protein
VVQTPALDELGAPSPAVRSLSLDSASKISVALMRASLLHNARKPMLCSESAGPPDLPGRTRFAQASAAAPEIIRSSSLGASAKRTGQLNAIAAGCKSLPCGYARAMAKDHLFLALLLLLIMLVAAIGIATVVILGAVEDCSPDGDCNISSSPSGLVLSR